MKCYKLNKEDINYIMVTDTKKSKTANVCEKKSKKSFVTKTMLKNVLNNNKKLFTIIIDDGEIQINNTNNEVLHQDIYNTLTYEKKEDCIFISKLLMSLIYKYNNIYTDEYYLDKYENGNSVLYVFLLPMLSEENKYIIKVGYTTNLCKRESELKKEFNIDDTENIYLIYIEHIKNESCEHKLHSILKKNKNITFYPIDKYKKNEKGSKSVETYIFNWLIYTTIIKEIYIMNNKDLIKQKLKLTNEESKLKDKEIDLAKINSEIAKIEAPVKLKDKEIELAKIELAKIEAPVKLKDKEIELAKIELAKIEANIRLKELELELAKLQSNKT